MAEQDYLADQFEQHRHQLRAIAYRMLGSTDEADDAVQEAWLRLSRSDDAAIENLGAWLTTVVGRVCLDMLRSRKARREEPIEETRLPEPIVTTDDADDPEKQALLADSVGLALLVVLESLSPPERLAFVLHDMFAVPFDEIAPVVGRSTEATRKLASRARQRVRGAAPEPEPDLERQREVVGAFLAASREGRFDDLVALLDPDVVLRVDQGRRGMRIVRGAEAVASEASRYSRLAPWARPALVNGAAGFVVAPHGRPFAVMGCTVSEGRITEMDIINDRERLDELDLSDFGL